LICFGSGDPQIHNLSLSKESANEMEHRRTTTELPAPTVAIDGDCSETWICSMAMFAGMRFGSPRMDTLLYLQAISAESVVRARSSTDQSIRLRI
jgi:hypothetical protein